MRCQMRCDAAHALGPLEGEVLTTYTRSPTAHPKRTGAAAVGRGAHRAATNGITIITTVAHSAGLAAVIAGRVGRLGRH